ncbi:hypothetical protein THAOC_03838 [Thalassiosira oceanica]|uniref:Uncharacterized protein n=1 Tax=Thalassiosira oceanica TaxID=159749 RepID=K0TAD3_THAOC|nr:hypothetical protein THAOC_03838 [Thalassiosira oceanica]|eukprot:EJK74480.1 hypothetical protein THAOC_03838 [Thalassiosira oceanica]
MAPRPSALRQHEDRQVKVFPEAGVSNQCLVLNPEGTSAGQYEKKTEELVDRLLKMEKNCWCRKLVICDGSNTVQTQDEDEIMSSSPSVAGPVGPSRRPFASTTSRLILPWWLVRDRKRSPSSSRLLTWKSLADWTASLAATQSSRSRRRGSLQHCWDELFMLWHASHS